MTYPANGQVIVVGEALVDLVARNDGTISATPGGGPFNTARALGRLGVPTHFLGSVSNDRFGREIASALEGDGVVFDNALVTDRPTSLAVAELDERGAASYRFYFEGTSAERIESDKALAALPAHVCAVHAGSLGLVLQPLAETVEAVVTKFAGNALVMLDPNIRPSILRDHASYLARLQRVMALSDIVKVSEEDMQFLAPDRPPLDAARALLGLGPRLVLLTLGARGAVALAQFGTCPVAAPAVAVVDTIGAGDIFSGAWLARWFELGQSLDNRDAVCEATSFACRVAALSCTHKGAVSPTRSIIELPLPS